MATERPSALAPLKIMSGIKATTDKSKPATDLDADMGALLPVPKAMHPVS